MQGQNYESDVLRAYEKSRSGRIRFFLTNAVAVAATFILLLVFFL